MAEERKPGEAYACVTKSIKILTDRGLHKVPNNFVLPESERPCVPPPGNSSKVNLPVIDMAALQRPHLVQEIGRACREWGFFQIVNHGISESLIQDMMRVTAEFFELPEQERSKYMSDDMSRPVRYGTSMNQNKDEILTWRDFLKVSCVPLHDMLHLWPSSPPDYRKVACEYATATKALAVRIMELVLESLGGGGGAGIRGQEESEEELQRVLQDFKEGSHVMVQNLYPPCPEPHLTWGIPPHTDYGCLTILAQDSVGGLQVMHGHGHTDGDEEWVSVAPVEGALLVNIGDHVEILSNGRYRSVMHRALTNSATSRLSVATLLTLAMHARVAPLRHVVLVDHGGHLPETEIETEAEAEAEVAYQSTCLADYLAFLAGSHYKPRAFIDGLRLRLPSGPSLNL